MAESGSRSTARVRIGVPEQYKALDEDVWADLEAYLFKGFLTSPSFLYGQTFVFKTLNHHELAYVRHFKPMRSTPVDVHATYRAHFVAYSIFIVDGENVLHGRPSHMRKLVEVVRKMDDGVQEEILANLTALNGRATRLHPLTEVYAHEPRSRFRWMQVVGTPVHSPMNTGVPGTDELGMNQCQQAWTALNRILDDRENVEAQWANAKFIGSCWNGKGVRSIEERDRARKEKERSDLEDLKMKVLYRYLNRLTGQEEVEDRQQLPDGRIATVVKRFRDEGVEALAAQLERAVNNEKDHHDLVIERHLNAAKARAAELRADRRALHQAPSIFDETKGRPLAAGSSKMVDKSDLEAQIQRLKGLQRSQMTEYYRKAEGEAVRQAFDSDQDGKDRR